jgi:hypothetical protein
MSGWPEWTARPGSGRDGHARLTALEPSQGDNVTGDQRDLLRGVGGQAHLGGPGRPGTGLALGGRRCRHGCTGGQQRQGGDHRREATSVASGGRRVHERSLASSQGIPEHAGTGVRPNGQLEGRPKAGGRRNQRDEPAVRPVRTIVERSCAQRRRPYRQWACPGPTGRSSGGWWGNRPRTSRGRWSPP